MILVTEKAVTSGIRIELKTCAEGTYLVPISSHCCKEEYKLKDPSSREKDIVCSCGKEEYYYVPYHRDRWYISSAWPENEKLVEWLAYWTGFVAEDMEVDIEWA